MKRTVLYTAILLVLLIVSGIGNDVASENIPGSTPVSGGGGGSAYTDNPDCQRWIGYIVKDVIWFSFMFEGTVSEGTFFVGEYDEAQLQDWRPWWATPRDYPITTHTTLSGSWTTDATQEGYPTTGTIYLGSGEIGTFSATAEIIGRGDPMIWWKGTGTFSGTDWADEAEPYFYIEWRSYFELPSEQEVDFDIKPTTIKLKSKGVIPVEILTTEDFDATSIDIDTVKLGPGEAMEAHGKLHLEDVDGDGELDAVLHFRVQEIGLEVGEMELTITGSTVDGVDFVGTDTVIVK